MSMVTGFAGGRRWSFTIRSGNLIATMAIGCTRTMDGSGCLIIHGVGRHFITVVGSMMRNGDGAGGRTPIGRHPGFAGAIPTVIADGLHCRRTQSIARVSDLNSMV